jgi:mRNA-degrading endonuclease toxin of MazEF toxin-antitoxin module
VRELWWCRLGINIGTEQDGGSNDFLRPVLILRSFGPDACLIAPLTTSTRKHWLRIPIGIINGKEAQVNLSQLRAVDTRRFIEKIGFLEEKIFTEIRKTIRRWF